MQTGAEARRKTISETSRQKTGGEPAASGLAGPCIPRPAARLTLPFWERRQGQRLRDSACWGSGCGSSHLARRRSGGTAPRGNLAGHLGQHSRAQEVLTSLAGREHDETYGFACGPHDLPVPREFLLCFVLYRQVGRQACRHMQASRQACRQVGK